MVSFKASVFLCCLLAVIVSGVMARDTKSTPDWQGWTPIDISEVPRALPGDVIEVRHALAPLLKPMLGDLLALLKLYHTGILFTNRRSNASLTTEFNAIPSVTAVLLPEIKQDENDEISLHWQDKGAAVIYHGIDYSYWSVEVNKVTTINGTIFNKFVDTFLATANSTYPNYNLFNVIEHWGGKQYIAAWTCFDYSFASVDYLYQLGAQMNYSVSGMKADIVNVYSRGDPVEVDYEAEKALIDNFFLTVELKFKHIRIQNFFEQIINVINLVQGKIYYRFKEKYYRIQLHHPFIDFKVIEEPLPGSRDKPRLLDEPFTATKPVRLPERA